MTTPLLPLGDRVLVEPIVQETTDSGIVIAGAELTVSRGTVLRLPPVEPTAAVHTPPVLSVGDIVLYPTHAGDTIGLDGKTLKLLPASSLLARVRPTPEDTPAQEAPQGGDQPVLPS